MAAAAPWTAGDTALCVRDDWEAICPGYRRVGDEPRAGQRLTVASVGICRATRQPAFLMFEPWGAAFEVEAFARQPDQPSHTGEQA
jgi:hypothetical protein